MPPPNIGDCSVNVSVVTDDQCRVVNRHGHFLYATNELFHWQAGLCQCFRPAINDNELAPVEANHPTAQKAAIVRFVPQNVFMTFRDVIAVATPCIV